MSDSIDEMLTVSVNGAAYALPSPTLDAALTVIGAAGHTPHIAIAVNDTVVPRARWHAVTLQHDDRVEIITAVAGG